jgi:hypothetical protein
MRSSEWFGICCIEYGVFFDLQRGGLRGTLSNRKMYYSASVRLYMRSLVRAVVQRINLLSDETVFEEARR